VALATEVPVTACGQLVTGKGSLVADLDCSGIVGPGVILADYSSLDLGSFTLSGGDGDGVLCQGYCVVRSGDTEVGGTIAGFSGDGVVARNPLESIGQVRVTRVTVRDNGGNGVSVDEADGSVTVGKSEVRGNGAMGVFSPQRMRINRSTISGNALEGIRGERVKITGSVVELNSTGVDASLYLNVDHSEIVNNTGDGLRVGASLRVFYTHVQGNGGSGIVFSAISGDAHIQLAEVSDNGLDGIRIDGPQTERLRMQVTFIRRNGRNGLVGNHMLVNQCRIDDNAFHGIYAPPGGEPCRVGIDRYSMVGNGTDPSCGVSVACADIATCDPPLNLGTATECGTSYDTSSGFPGTNWGICDDD
jgi:hypothetical protein